MTQEETKKMLEAMKSDSGGEKKFWSPEAGDNIIRFLPPMKKNEEVLPYLHHRVHWIEGTPYECVDQKMVDKEGNLHEAQSCPACKAAKKLFKVSEKDTEERDLAWALNAKDRFVFRIVDRKKEAKEQITPEFYEVGKAIQKKFFSIMQAGKYGNIVHPVEGRDYTISKVGTGRLTNYDTSMPEPSVTKLFDSMDDIKACLEKATSMKYNSLIEFRSVDVLSQAVTEFLNPDTDDEGTGNNTVNTANKEKVEEKFEEKADNFKEEVSDDSSNDVDDILDEFI